MGCRRVLVVGDGDPVAGHLESQGFEVHVAYDPPAAISWLGDSDYGCLVVSERLPIMGGLVLCPILRMLTDAPVLMLSEDGGEDSVCRSLSVANGFLQASAGEWLLCSTVRALMRRPPTAGAMRCFGVEVDPASHSASVDGRPVSLAKTEYEMLRVLVRANGRAVSKLEIECSVWGADMPADGTFKTHVHRLRKAIGADRLATVRGQGYALQPKPCVNRGLRGLL